MKHIAFLLAACVLSAIAPAQAADDCKLTMVADLDIASGADEDLTVPVAISGKTYHFLLTVADTRSWVSTRVAQAANAKIDKTRYYGPDGHMQTLSVATLPDVTIGKIQADTLPLNAWDEAPNGTDGQLGLSVLANYDLELDLASHRARLFRPGHCPGKVVYWGKDYAVIPLLGSSTVTQDAAYVTLVPHFDVLLDGKTFHALANTRVRTGLMGTRDARDAFGFDADDPALTALPAGPFGEKRFRYPFKTLTAGGVTIVNPAIELYEQGRTQQCNGKFHYAGDHTVACFQPGNLSIGRQELSALHLYFAFKEMNLYITAADPPPTPH